MTTAGLMILMIIDVIVPVGAKSVDHVLGHKKKIVVNVSSQNYTDFVFTNISV